jgi:hypothetical protein
MEVLMKKKWIVVPSILVVLIFAWVLSMAGARVDPSGVMRRLLEIEQAHSESMNSFLHHLKLDYHPKLGTVKKETLPFHKEGWDDKYASQLFPQSEFKNIQSISKTIFSGTLLVTHRTDDGRNFHVWHRYKNEPGIFVTAQMAGSEEPKTVMVVLATGNPVYLSSDDLVCRIAGHQVAMRLKKW